jgi:RNA polymerase sigma-70 factor (ECF subfamily)
VAGRAGHAASRAPRSAAPATERAAGAPHAAEDLEIARERALLQGALAALSAGRDAEAARCLDEHARKFPAGRLTAERQTALRALRARAARENVDQVEPL